jgi:hypothetical protein
MYDELDVQEYLIEWLRWQHTNGSEWSRGW